MRWLGVQPLHNLQPGRVDGGQQVLTRPQAKVFGQVGEDKPGFGSGLPDVRCAAQRHHRARIKRNQQQAENASTVRG